MSIVHATKPQGGFTLLEVMVAIGILAISLTGLFAVQGGSMELASHSKYLTVATLLARSKMIDVEQKLLEEGFSDFAEADEGDFEEEGWSDFRWRMEMTKVRMPVPSSMPGGAEDGQANAQANNALAAGSSFLTDLIANSMRECNVEVIWMEGGEEQNLKVSTHYINVQNLTLGTFASSSGSSSSSESTGTLGGSSNTSTGSKTSDNPFTKSINNNKK